MLTKKNYKNSPKTFPIYSCDGCPDGRKFSMAYDDILSGGFRHPSEGGWKGPKGQGVHVCRQCQEKKKAASK